MIDNDVEVGPLTSGDLVALAQCHALYCTAFPAAGFPPIARDAVDVWVAKREGRTVGLIATHTIGRVFEVHAVAVEPGHRGAGIGRALMREAIEAARSRKRASVVLQVSTANVAACALYRSVGFVVKRTLRGYYSSRHFDNEGDAYQMQLTL